MSRQNDIEVVESEVEETSDSDYSQEDPSFHILEETQSKFSNLSIKKKPRSRVPAEVDEDIDFTKPEFDANDEKCFEIVEKMIEGCQVEKLKVEQCKLYLRKHGLRLTGKKDILIQRIKEHMSIKNGEGEDKYPASSFVMNCKGDACTGDVVMFEQNVYEMFNIASRSASGPSCGKRVVAGRIVKESYGAAKQQHTFTIEVLWSKGVKPLPPLHPLLIKGRNLYRLKTMRQIWEDESQRQKTLSEKHARGHAARTDREARLHERETRKALRENRDSKGNKKQEKITKTTPSCSILNPRTSIQLEALNSPDAVSNTCVGGVLADRPSKSMSHGALHNENNNNHTPIPPWVRYGSLHNENVTPNTCRGLAGGMSHKYHGASHNENFTPNSCSNRPSKSMFHNHHVSRGVVDGPYNKSFQGEQNLGWLYPYPSSFCYPPHRHRHSYSFQQASTNGYALPRGHYHYQEQKQHRCKYYAQGRCHYGTNCKYLH